jgi:DNA-binding response OmpR family regulator
MAETLTAPRHGQLGERPRVDSAVVRVLVAEDDQGLGKVLARGLRERGYVVDQVPDGETAPAGVRIETVRGVGYRVVAS